MRALFDVNALLAVFDVDHVLHRRARKWWAGSKGDGWATCPLTQNGFVRIISQPGYSQPWSIFDACNVLRIAASQPSHEFWPDDISLLDPQRVYGDRILGPKQITDIYLLALAVKNGGRLVTFDQGIPSTAVRDAQAHHVVVL